MMLAHIAGVPFEEWLAPVAVSGYYAYTMAKRLMGARMSSHLTTRAAGRRGVCTSVDRPEHYRAPQAWR